MDTAYVSSIGASAGVRPEKQAKRLFDFLVLQDPT